MKQIPTWANGQGEWTGKRANGQGEGTKIASERTWRRDKNRGRTATRPNGPDTPPAIQTHCNFTRFIMCSTSVFLGKTGQEGRGMLLISAIGRLAL